MRERAAALPTRWRLALLGALGVALAIGAACLALNVFENGQIAREAESSLDEALGWEASNGMPATRVANYLLLDEDFGLVEDEALWYAELDERIAAWCAHSAQPNAVQRAVLGDVTCYLELTYADEAPAAYPDHWGPASQAARRERYLVAYIDVSPQLAFVRAVDVAFGVIALVGCALAAWAGLRMGERIEAADEAQRRLFENVSHELKTPLAAARGYAEAVQEDVMPADEAAQGIVRETDRMARLVDQILGLARLDAGAVVLRPERVELADFVQDCLMPLEGAVRAKGLQVELELAPGEVELDPELMGHALENVLSNAVRHAERLLRVSFDGQALVVANDGTMPRPEDVDHLFDRFRTSEGGSTGLGLAIAREVVELHGWQLGARLEGELLCVRFQVRV